MRGPTRGAHRREARTDARRGPTRCADGPVTPSAPHTAHRTRRRRGHCAQHWRRRPPAGLGFPPVPRHVMPRHVVPPQGSLVPPQRSLPTGGSAQRQSPRCTRNEGFSSGLAACWLLHLSSHTSNVSHACEPCVLWKPCCGAVGSGTSARCVLGGSQCRMSDCVCVRVRIPDTRWALSRVVFSVLSVELD